MKRSHHPQRETKQGILVDEQMVNILELLWDHGLTTYNSCQDNFGTIWIEFDLDSYNALCIELQDSKQLADYMASTANVECREDEDDQQKSFLERLVLVSLRFPKEDLQWLEVQLAAAFG